MIQSSVFCKLSNTSTSVGNLVDAGLEIFTCFAQAQQAYLETDAANSGEITLRKWNLLNWNEV